MAHKKGYGHHKAHHEMSSHHDGHQMRDEHAHDTHHAANKAMEMHDGFSPKGGYQEGETGTMDMDKGCNEC